MSSTLTICDVKARHVTIRTKCQVYLNSDEPEMARPCEEHGLVRLPRQLLYSQLRDGKRNHGRPRLRFNDIVKRNLKRKNILLDSWRQRERPGGI